MEQETEKHPTIFWVPSVTASGGFKLTEMKESEVSDVDLSNGVKFIKSGGCSGWLKFGDEIFDKKEDAENKAREILKKKIKSAKKQLEKLENIKI